MGNATEKQMKLIRNIEMLLCDVKFTGVTIAEASKFISEHIERYKKERDIAFEMIYNENNY